MPCGKISLDNLCNVNIIIDLGVGTMVTWGDFCWLLGLWKNSIEQPM